MSSLKMKDRKVKWVLSRGWHCGRRGHKERVWKSEYVEPVLRRGPKGDRGEGWMAESN
jgi:hypothetical protein